MSSIVAIGVMLTVLLSGAARAAEASGADAAAPSSEAPTTPSTGAAVDEILTDAAPSGEYLTKTKCLLSVRLNRTEVLSERFVLFHVGRNELWIARLTQRCSGLTPRSKLTFEKRNYDRICQWDTLRTVAQEDSSMPQFGPMCPLPEFEAVTSEQVELLKNEIKSARYRPGKRAPQ